MMSQPLRRLFHKDKSQLVKFGWPSDISST